ncbi:MAG: pilin [Candidatus Pacebacteria bacterium]|nr:pilin [Candidatus Paceibacterota bacterium]
MNKLITIILALLSPAVALAEYPVIGGRTITDKSTLSDFVLYYFALALIIGIVAAVLVLITAGINFLISQGDLYRRNNAKRMITGAFVGLVVLFGSFVILNALSSSATGPISEPEVIVSDGIYLIKEDGEKLLTYQDVAKTEKNFTAIEWISSQEDLPAIYVYAEKDFKGVPAEIKNGNSVSISQGSSIAFLWKTAGVYLYDKTNYQLSDKSAPLPVKFDQPSLGGSSFDNITQSIKITQPEEGSSFGAILFSEADYRGTCSWILGETPDLSQARGEENNPAIGNDTLSSLILLNTAPGSPTVTFYNRADCQYVEQDPRSKKCDISSVNITGLFEDSCSEFEGDVLSFSLSQGAGVLLKTENGQCQFFKRQKPQECVSLIKYGYTYSPGSDLRPYSFTMFSLEK